MNYITRDDVILANIQNYTSSSVVDNNDLRCLKLTKLYVNFVRMFPLVFVSQAVFMNRINKMLYRNRS